MAVSKDDSLQKAKILCIKQLLEIFSAVLVGRTECARNARQKTNSGRMLGDILDLSIHALCWFLVQITHIWSGLAYNELLLSLTNVVCEPELLFSSWEIISISHTIRSLYFPVAEEMGITLYQKESASLAFKSLEWNFSLILPAKSWPVQESLKRNCGSLSLRNSKSHISRQLEAASWSVGGNFTPSLYPITNSGTS